MHSLAYRSPRPACCADAEGTALPDVPVERLQDPHYAPLPRYWVPAQELDARLEDKWSHRWLLGWRDICRSTDERTVIAGVVPRVGVGHKLPLFFPGCSDTRIVAGAYAGLCSLAFDYVARQKIGGTSLTYFYLKQLPFVAPATVRDNAAWGESEALSDWVIARVLELTYSAQELAAFADDLGYKGQPFRWDEARRFLIRCELDAAYLYLYLGTPEEWQAQGPNELLAAFPAPSDAVAYILDTFPIVRRKDEQAHGEYRTKRVILEIYDEMQQASDTGKPYRTRLEPPPADPRVAHAGDERPQRVRHGH